MGYDEDVNRMKLIEAVEPMSSIFNSPEFLGDGTEVFSSGIFPFCSVSNPIRGSETFGMSIKSEMATLVGWDDEMAKQAGWEEKDWEYSDGTKSPIWLSRTPRFSILNRSPLQIKAVFQDEDAQYLPYQEEVYKRLKASPEVKSKQLRVDVFSRSLIVPFLGNIPIVSMPIALTTKGAVGAVFGKALTEHYKACSPILQELTKSKKRVPLTEPIMAHIILDGQFVKEKAGTPPDVSLIAKLLIAPPTAESFLNPEVEGSPSKMLLAWQKDYADAIAPRYDTAPAELLSAPLSALVAVSDEEPVF